MRTTDKIYEIVASADEPVTLKQIQDQLEIKPNILSGMLASLIKSKRLTRERVERTNGTGPKMQWAYKILAQEEKIAV